MEAAPLVRAEDLAPQSRRGSRGADPVDRPDIAQPLVRALNQWDHDRPRYEPRLRIPSDRPGNPLRVDPSLREQLRQLGYTEESP